jgi:hydroxyethylthiazole kinase-like uncharacterized protein yjeF
MMRQEVDDFGLINLMTWHALQKHALNNHSWYHSFSADLIQFFKQTLEIPSSQKLLIVCADKSRMAMVEVIALTLAQAGVSISIYLPPKLAKYRSTLPGVEFCMTLDESNIFAILDCIASLSDKKPSKEQLRLIQQIQHFECLKVALDCPSGLNADTGYPNGEDVLAVDYTLSSFYHLKGLWTGLAREFVGHAALCSTVRHWDQSLSCSARLMHEELIQKFTPKRLAYAHKACFKRVVVVAGDSEMFGAAIMAAKSALIMGAGLVEVLMPQGISPPYAELPEIIWHALNSGFELSHYIQANDILVLGPGFGSGAWAASIWEIVKTLSNPVVLDASGLAYLAIAPFKRDNWIVTPHPGEAAQLLSCTNQRIQEDRFRAIDELNSLYGMTCVLKGSGTLVASPRHETFICPLGHPGMATPGMGDVLTGLIAGLWAQGLDACQAAILGVWLHAYAADLVAQRSVHGVVIATELIAQLQHGFNI